MCPQDVACPLVQYPEALPMSATPAVATVIAQRAHPDPRRPIRDTRAAPAAAAVRAETGVAAGVGAEDRGVPGGIGTGATAALPVLPQAFREAQR